MRWRYRDRTEWHVIFAWLPHAVGGRQMAWLKDVERRWYRPDSPMVPGWWTYRQVQDSPEEGEP